MSQKEVITFIEKRQDFLDLLKINQGLIIIDLKADWCGPCKTIQQIVDAFFASSPENVICCSLNVDENIDIYSYLKKNRVVNGIPALLCYIQGNYSFSPSFSVTGSNPKGLDDFFKRCGIELYKLDKIKQVLNQTR